ncbi:YceI family protein [Candidatus Uhrbacteria bacterium]|nr:YceI family protein [Candidatus Uhrbacteria bacterium]
MKKAVFVVSIFGLVSVFCFSIVAADAAAPANKGVPTKKVVTPVKKAVVKKAVAKKAPPKKKMTVKKAAKAKTSATLYRLVTPSAAQFSVGETLRGEPFTAVGTTQQVSGGDISLAWAAPGKTTMSPISIDAQTFKTDSGSRDFMIRKFILKAEDAGNQYIVFTPKKISGLPSMIRDGSALSFVMEGDLKIAGITKTALFKGNARIASGSLKGSATATVKRSDYKISIPEVPFVASVDENVLLSINLTAK